MIDCVCDYDPATVYSAEIVKKARKEHKCFECDRTIHRGERYERVFGIWDGDVSVFRTCTHCLEIREYVRAHVPCFCCAHGNVVDDAKATAEEWNHEAPGLLFGLYRRIIVGQRFRLGASHAHA